LGRAFARDVVPAFAPALALDLAFGREDFLAAVLVVDVFRRAAGLGAGGRSGALAGSGEGAWIEG
jgi:hypothetical protein